MVNLSDPDSARAEPYLTAEADLRRIAVSPDGSLAAYRSDESGQDEIYIRSFPDPGERTLVSQGGGTVPFWSPDGNTLYYATGSANRSWLPAFSEIRCRWFYPRIRCLLAWVLVLKRSQGPPSIPTATASSLRRVPPLPRSRKTVRRSLCDS